MPVDQSYLADLLAGVKQLIINGVTLPRRNVARILTGATAVDNPNYQDPVTGKAVGSTDITLATGGALTPFLFATLRSTPASGNHSTQGIDGYTVQSDGGQGLFYWDPNETVLADDGGTVVQVTSPPTPNGRWKRVLTDHMAVEYFGVFGDGVTNQSSALSTVDGFSNARGYRLHFPKGTYVIGSNLTINSLVSFAPGAMLKINAGVTLTLNGGYRAEPTQQVFSVQSTGAVRLLNTKPTAEIWLGHFGAIGDGNNDDTSAIQAAFATWQAAAQAGFALKLRAPGGVFHMTSPVVVTNCAIGGTIEGAGGNGQTVFSFSDASLGGKIGLDLQNCIGLRMHGIKVIARSGVSTTLTANAATGATTLQLTSSLAGLTNGMQLIVATTGAAQAQGLSSYEFVTVSAGAGTTTLTVSALVGSYSTGDTVYFMPVAACRVFEDSTQAGLSTTNRFDECTFGNNGAFSTGALYGLVVDFNSSGSDVNNPNHYFTNCTFQQGVEAGVYLRGTNAENICFVNCQLIGGYGLKTANGSSFMLVDCAFNVNKADIYAQTGQQQDKSTVYGGYSEGGGQFLKVDTGSTFFDLSCDGFSRKGGTQCTIGTTAANATVLTVYNNPTNLSPNGANYFYPGQTLDIFSFDGTVYETAIVDHVVNLTTLVIRGGSGTGGGLLHAYNQGGNAYAAVITARPIDADSSPLQVHLEKTFLGYGLAQGSLFRFRDSAGAGGVTINASRVAPVGFTADGVIVSHDSTFWQQANDGTRKITLLNGALEVAKGSTTSVIGAVGTAWYPGDWRGAQRLYAAQRTVTTATYAVDSNWVKDWIISVNRAGAVTVTLPVPEQGRQLVIHDSSGLAGTNNITIAQHAAEKINGANTFVMNQNYQAVLLWSDGTSWFAK